MGWSSTKDSAHLWQIHSNKICSLHALSIDGTNQSFNERLKFGHLIKSTATLKLCHIGQSVTIYKAFLQRTHILNNISQLPFPRLCINFSLANTICKDAMLCQDYSDPVAKGAQWAVNSSTYVCATWSAPSSSSVVRTSAPNTGISPLWTPFQLDFSTSHGAARAA